MRNWHGLAVRYHITLTIARLVIHLDHLGRHFIADIDFVASVLFIIFVMLGATAARYEAATATLLTTGTVHAAAYADRQNDERQEGHEDKSERP